MKKCGRQNFVNIWQINLNISQINVYIRTEGPFRPECVIGQNSVLVLSNPVGWSTPLFIIIISMITMIRGRVQQQLHQTLGKVIKVHLSNDEHLSAKMYSFMMMYLIFEIALSLSSRLSMSLLLCLSSRSSLSSWVSEWVSEWVTRSPIELCT